MTALELQDRVTALAAKAKSQAEANRARAPEFAQFVDHCKAVFGADTKVRYVQWPDGSEQGRPGPAGVPVTLPPKKAPAERSATARQVAAEAPRARRSDPGTSKAAAAVATILASDHHERILAALDRPSTAYDIAARCGMGQVAVARRMGELRDAGLVTDTGRTALGPTGRQCTVWARLV